jgi:hypothetical protein
MIINNLPQHLRFLCENMALVLIFPGPHEPNDYMLNQIMEPLIDELLVLQKGEYSACMLVDLHTHYMFQALSYQSGIAIHGSSIND